MISSTTGCCCAGADVCRCIGLTPSPKKHTEVELDPVLVKFVLAFCSVDRNSAVLVLKDPRCLPSISGLAESLVRGVDQIGLACGWCCPNDANMLCAGTLAGIEGARNLGG